jgi:diamine N-acetyltransferase
MNTSLPARDAPLEFVEVTAANYGDALRLKVRPDQERFVAANAVSIAQAHFHPEAWYRLIHAGGTPVGFVMLEDWTALPDKAPADWKADPYVGLWRFMIDQRYQRLGFGARALPWLIDHARRRPGAKCMLLSFVEAEGSPEPFYRRFGFVRTGEVVEGEHMMRLAF